MLFNSQSIGGNRRQRSFDFLSASRLDHSMTSAKAGREKFFLPLSCREFAVIYQEVGRNPGKRPFSPKLVSEKSLRSFSSRTKGGGKAE